jgi:hypothetical protein
MRAALAVLLAFLIGLQPAAVCTQAGQQQASAAPSQAAKPPDPATPPPSVESLGLSLARIKRELGDRPATENKDGLKLDFYVEVFAFAPPIPIFQPGELTTGPVPWGPPTHADFLKHVTPEAFRSPAVPISSIAIMGIAYLMKQEADRQKRRKAEEEIKKRNDELRKKYPYLVAEPKK